MLTMLSSYFVKLGTVNVIVTLPSLRKLEVAMILNFPYHNRYVLSTFTYLSDRFHYLAKIKKFTIQMN